MLFVFYAICNGCSESTSGSSQKDANCDTLTLNTLTELLNKGIDEIPGYACYTKRDTVIEGDEGESWKAKAYYNKSSELAFIAETSWENAKTVSRITILSSQIKEGNLSIGQKFETIKSELNSDIPTSPDGYLFVQPRNNNKVFVQLDISKRHEDSTLFYGTKDINKIPDDLIVESIIIR